MTVNRSADLLQLLRKKQAPLGLYVVRVITTSPDTLVFEGTNTPVDQDLFEVPKRLKPLTKGSRYFTLPITTQDSSNRWGILDEID
jgi:hypothetical protein